MQHETGHRVADRYRLDHVLVESPDMTLWRGHDEVLDRPVAVRLVADTHPRLDAVLDAARSTAGIDDRRIARVLDADRVGGDAFVVTAWAIGRDLSVVLRESPLDADEALAVVGEVADAVAFAHERGIPHLALDPTNVILAGDEVTILGLAVDAVLHGDTDPDAEPGRADAAGLGALLYACLTARWPFGDDDTHGLDPAPRVGLRLCTPRQVRAAVPSGVDALCRRALDTDPLTAPVPDPAAFVAEVRALQQDTGRARWRPSSWFRGTRAVASR